MEKKKGAKEAKVETKNTEIEAEEKEKSYKARLIFNDKQLAIDIPIRWTKFDSKEIDKEYPILYRNAKGEEVRYKSWVEDKVVETGADKKEGWLLCDEAKKTSMRKLWTNAEGEGVTDKPTAYQVVEGKENAVEKNKKTDEFKVLALKDIAEYDDWQPESDTGLYKIWGETPLDVYSLGQFVKKYLIDGNKFAAIKISIGSSYKEYYGLIKPVIKDGKFGLTMKISRIKIDWAKGEALMDFLKDKPAEEAPKTKPKNGLDAL